ncbi:MAG: hypothetical protein LKE88_11750 [Acidaminococcus provencensis]|jgi:hypothetical protein|uniref:hypothetical protein n=1 Tax=Acidaminococcus provencensis TaxID=2058289 RepID=UPI0023F17B97|nr:hypothetical protein [Acidaminococcus provencensis]MCH4097289.1 hypothetical protein [Acidaminococcus provencensis]
MRFKLPKRCPYCARKLDAEGKCVNQDCIAYVLPKEAENTTEADTNESNGKGVAE